MHETRGAPLEEPSMPDPRAVRNDPHAPAQAGAPAREGGPAQRDSNFARVLLDHLARDCARFDHSRDWGPIVLWMAEEVRRHAGSLAVPRETARRMRDEASLAQAKVLRHSA